MVDVTTLEIYTSIINYIKVVEKHFNVEDVFLFGSYASNTATKDSDIDLAIVSKSFSENRFNENVVLGKLTWGIDTRIEPIGFTPDEFETRLLALEIKKRGIKIPIN